MITERPSTSIIDFYVSITYYGMPSFLKFWKWFRSSESKEEISITEMIVPETIATSSKLAKRVIRYRDPEVLKFIVQVPYYQNIHAHELGDLVRLKNDALAMITDVRGRNFPLIISPYRSDLPSLLEKLNIIRQHQQMVNTDWPLQNDPRFKEKLQRIFSNMGLKPEGGNFVNPQACFKDDGNIVLKYYQKIVSTYSVYGPYRGVLVVHSMGTGKTCTAIAAIDNFLAFCKLEQETLNKADPVSDPVKIKQLHDPISPLPSQISLKAKDVTPTKLDAVEGGVVSPAAIVTANPKSSAMPTQLGGAATKASLSNRIFVVIPPSANLEQNFRSELSRCPSKIKEMILAQKEKGSKLDANAVVNRIINQNLTIISYVSLSNRLKKNLMTIDNCLLILDEAHNFLEPPPQFAAAYKHLYEVIKKTQNVKLLLLTGTPIYKSVTDLPRLLNLLKRSTEEKFPETEHEFFAKYFVNGKINAHKFGHDIQGYISFYDAENDLSYFAKKVEMLPIITHVTDEHYLKWLESRKTENKSYGFGDKLPPMNSLVTIKNPKFKSPVSGYFKRSSAVANTPLNYRRTGRWPDKFTALAAEITKYPKEKHFVFSRHTAYGANALGQYLEQELGWDRMSNNKQDHGSNPPTYFNPLAKELTAWKDRSAKSDPEIARSQKLSILKKHVKKPYQGFVVANKATTQRDLNYGKVIFNDIPDNIDGKICRVFIADERFSEGLSLLNTTHVHVLDSTYSHQQYRQIIARAVRNCSHKNLKFPWQVKIHKYLSSLDDEHPMTDDLLKDYSDASQAILQQVIDGLVKNSIEAGFSDLHKHHVPQILAKESLWARFMKLFSKKYVA